ncbi:class I SAM-dependent methyltransferase [Streptomyces sp. NPDC050509]|uniref:class I SAM-dependent methyltransferase n=1 Tax=Streptomyces sp. NPDC050509 TaxID=3365620 RepID=UPI00378A71DB
MVDRLFSDRDLAALYDAVCAGRPDFAFYLPLVMSARSVLDVGCGTGDLLHQARAAGHPGRLCGLDPADGMLEQARRRTDVEWILGDLSTTHWDRAFDLVVMTGHAFQVLLEDEEVRGTFAAVRAALTDEGRFVFETRDPAARAWGEWTPDRAVEVVDATGAVVRVANEADPYDGGDRVSFTTRYTSPGWDGPRLSRSTLRFLGADEVTSFLAGAGLTVEAQYGDWLRQPLTGTGPEIITVAARGRGQEKGATRP